MTENGIATAPQDALALLLDVLELRPDGEDRFVAVNPDPDAPRVFGGQVAAQATLAASRTVPAGHRLVSLHCTYIRMGRGTEPIQLEVERIGDGRTFAFRRVLARQGDRLICTASASFHAGGEGPAHEWPQAACPDPAQLPLYEPGHPVMVTEAFELRRALDPVDAQRRGMDLAIRTVGALPDDPHLHAALAVYVSDMYILDASLLPHQAEPVVFTDYNVATVDHTIQLHAPVRLDDWVVNRFESPLGGGGLSEVRCEMRSASGARIGTALQRGILVHHRA
ncbi:MAG TPA: acyl-CoA thioesterase domain-containing protein [Nocardioides sp.]|nr:acyl-CoA thioesterase domain-containing protein [Nocardioides sp.]